MLLVQGAGNSLLHTRCGDMVKDVVEAVQAVKDKMCVAVVGVFQQP